MKTPLIILVIMILSWCVIAPLLSCVTDGEYSFIELNSYKKDPEFIMPKKYGLLYNYKTNKYIVWVQDSDWKSLDKELRLRVYSSGGLNSAMWSCSTNDDATTFRDSSVAKHYARLWYENQQSKTYKLIK